MTVHITAVRVARALRVTRISLLAGELKSMHLSSSGALLSGAASIRLYQLVASVLTLLFTTSAIVRALLPPLTVSTVLSGTRYALSVRPALLGKAGA